MKNILRLFIGFGLLLLALAAAAAPDTVKCTLPTTPAAPFVYTLSPGTLLSRAVTVSSSCSSLTGLAYSNVPYVWIFYFFTLPYITGSSTASVTVGPDSNSGCSNPVVPPAVLSYSTQTMNVPASGTTTITATVYICAPAQYPARSGDYNQNNISLAHADFNAIIGQPPTGNAGAFTQKTSPFNFTMHVDPYCIVGNPGSIYLNYLTYSPTSVSSSVSKTGISDQFTTQCNQDHTLKLTTTTGTLSGLPYALTLTDLSNNNADGVLNVIPSSATSAPIWSFKTTATVPAGLAGDCTGGCTQSAIHTLTVTY